MGDLANPYDRETQPFQWKIWEEVTGGPEECLREERDHYREKYFIAQREIATLTASLAEARERLARYEEWPADREGDRPIAEDTEIEAAFPTRSKSYATYEEAMRMVGAKRSKGALVALVNWLLITRAAALAAKGAT